MRKINKIIVHCSDSDYSHHDDISVIRKWHTEERGWKDVGYHFFIQASGNVQWGRPIEQAGAHVSGQNKDSIGICLHGKQKFTQQQFNSLKSLLFDLIRQFDLTTNDVYGHRDFDRHKTCPNFDVKTV